jgi:hypothetical protein
MDGVIGCLEHSVKMCDFLPQDRNFLQQNLCLVRHKFAAPLLRWQLEAHFLCLDFSDFSTQRIIMDGNDATGRDRGTVLSRQIQTGSRLSTARAKLTKWVDSENCILFCSLSGMLSMEVVVRIVGKE